MIRDFDITNWDHISAIHSIYTPYVTGATPSEWRTSFEFTCPTPTELRDRFQVLLQNGFPMFVMLNESPPHSLVGYAYAGPYRTREGYKWTAEAAIYLAKSVQGSGKGTLLYTHLLTSLRHLGYRTVMGVITYPNAGSMKLHTKVGFEFKGKVDNVGWKNGENLSQVTYAKILDSTVVTSQLPPPKSWSKL